MGDSFNVNSKGKSLDNEKSAEQKKRLEEIEARKEANDKAANDKAKAAKSAAETAAQAAKELAAAASAASAKSSSSGSTLEDVASIASTAAGAVATELKSGSKKGKLSTKNVVIIAICVAIIGFVLWRAWPQISLSLGLGQSTPTTASQLAPDSTMGYNHIDFNNAILGEARQKQDLVVWEQDVQVDTEISNALANIAIFKKTKTIHSYGTGVYTVDMSKIADSSITTDDDAKTVTISIPHTNLQYITEDLSKTQFEDTEHALLGFGDIKLTEEQQNLVEQSIMDSMRSVLTTSDRYKDADDAALLMVYDTFEPVVSKVSDEYKVEIVFDEATTNADITSDTPSTTESGQ